jgi:glutamyl-tRNA reductase
MHIVVVGLSHKSAPIELRERLAFGREQLQEAFARLRTDVGLREAAILSTCNRVEIYGGTSELDGTLERLSRFLSAHSGIELVGLAPRLYSYTEPASIRHLFTVASGLDSMVLGEAEILHQVKHAYEAARDHGAAGKLLHTLFQRAFNTAKAVRSRTGIGRGCTSIGTVSVELAGKIFGRLSGAVVVLLGAGKIGELTVRRLADRGVKELRILNRSPERAAQLAAAHGASALPIERLAEQLADADIVIASTSASSPVLHQGQVADAMRVRRQRPLCFVDLGVPRNLDPAIGSLENVYLFDIDDLQGLVQHVHRERLHAVGESQTIIDRKVERFLAWWQAECVPS